MNRDLTTGKPETVLWKFCLPLFGSIIFQQLYNIAGNSYEITLIFIAFAFGCNMGCSVIVSQLYGARDYGKLKSAVTTACLFSAVLCAVLMVIGILGCAPLLHLIRTPQEVFADSQLYLDIYVWGLPFVFFYNIATGIFSALGDSRTPFCFLAASSTSNIAVDILFVTAFDMGVAGVAWATFLCQGVSCILAIIAVLKRLAGIHTDGKLQIYSGKMLKQIAVIAVPSILQQSFISVGNIIIQSVINDCGVGVTAGYSAAVKLNNLVITSFTTLANGISNYTAQNMGAGILHRVKSGFKAGVKIVWLLCIPIVILYLFAAKALITFFINSPSDLALASGMQFLYVVAPFYFVISIKLVADSILRGARLMKMFMITTFTDLILRVALAEILAKQTGYIGIWCAWPIGWSIAMVLSIIFYHNGPWNKTEDNSQ